MRRAAAVTLTRKGIFGDGGRRGRVAAKGLGTHGLEHVMRGAQLLARVAAVVLVAQPFPVHQVGAGELGLARHCPRCSMASS